MERISIESEQDKAIGTLGETLGTCWFRTHTGLCKSEQCAACPTKQKLDSCYAYLDDFNKLAVENEATKHAARLMLQSDGGNGCKMQARFGAVGAGLLWWLWTMFRCAFLLFSIVIFPYLMFGCAAYPAPTHEQEEQYIREIECCLKMAHDNIRDVNNDGKINCVDYSVVFKESYDMLSGSVSKCMFTVNKNPENGFNHMFVRIYNPYGIHMAFVEPQARDRNRMYVAVFWGDRYNRMYDIYKFGKFWNTLDKCEWVGKQAYYKFVREDTL